MTSLTIEDYLKYANLQVAAEAFLKNERTGETRYSGQALIEALKEGNNHASRFTATQATEFADSTSGWTVLDQRADTSTGFSGTLFKNNATDELVVSFRSTEFVDDAIRDSAATNTMEISATGWAWGQIVDMEAWFAELNADPDKLQGMRFSVTGYSLGGHLATAFNLLHGQENIDGTPRIEQVVTFNGAGVGRMRQGTFAEALDYFRGLLADPALIRTALDITTPELAQLYDSIRQHLADTTWTAVQAKAALDSLTFSQPLYTESQIAVLEAEKKPLADALAEIITLQEEAARIRPYTAGGNGADAGTHPNEVVSTEILAQSFDYRLAVALAGRRTESADLASGAVRGIAGKEYDAPMLTNQWDVVGTETTTPVWSAVANSLWHHGTDVPLFIEDQPFVRGDFVADAVKELLDYGSVKLLVDKYNENNFADNHSLVLIVDSLNVQNALLQLVPESERSPTATLLDTIMREASWRKAEPTGGTQGKAEGDVLENIVNALADLTLGPNPTRASLNGSPDGNTWASILDTEAYSGREKFYARLKEIQDSSTFNALKGKLSLVENSTSLADDARDDFGAYAALYSLSPFTFNVAWDADPTAVHDAFMNSPAATWYSSWKTDRDAVVAGQSATHISDQWLKDRTEFLQRKNWFGAKNVNPLSPTFDILREHDNPNGIVHLYRTDNTLFVDKASGYTIAQGFNPETPPDFIRRYYFDDASDNANIQGGGAEDHLYGMAGNDSLVGNGGNDTLDGGAGNDTLKGGADFDTYIVGAGNDRIIDSDGQGQLLDGSGKPVAGQFVGGNNTYTLQRDGQTFIATLAASELTLSLPSGGTLVIENYDRALGTFGIGLADASLETRVLDGDQAPVEYSATLGPNDPFGEDWRDIVVSDVLDDNGQIIARNVTYHVADELGNLVTGGAEAGRDDTLYDSAGDDVLRGHGGNDVLTAPRGLNDILDGGDGNDSLSANAGDDVLIGGAGQDTLDGGDNSDRLFADGEISHTEALARLNDAPSGLVGDTMDGGAGADWLVGSAGSDWLDGGSGDDELIAGGGDDDVAEVAADSGADRIFGGGGKDKIWAGAGRDYVDGGRDGDVISGGDGDDEIFGDRSADLDAAPTGLQGDLLDGWTGDDELTGGAGNDFLAGGGDNDTLRGGTGNDDIWADDYVLGANRNWQVHRTVTNENGTPTYRKDASFSTSEGVGNDFVEAGAGDDWVFAGAGVDYVDGGDGADVVFGDGGDDELFGGIGNDVITGDDAAIALALQGNDYVDGEGGNDTLFGNGGNDSLFGGEDHDALQGGAADDYLDGEAGNDTLFGQADKDTLIGGAGSDELQGGDGNDTLDGGTGVDRLFGQAGDDHLAGGDGADELQGGADNDTLDGGAEADLLLGGSGADVVAGGAGDDQIAGDNGGTDTSGGADTISGGLGNDQIDAQGGNDVVDGGDGNDGLLGGGGNDWLAGGAGDDTLLGDAGNDTLAGGTGTDTLDGGAGDDTYRLALGDGAPDALGQTDLISDRSGVNTVRFGAGITPETMTVALDATSRYLLVSYGEQGDTLAIEDGAAGNIGCYEFADGPRLTFAELIGRAAATPATGISIDGTSFAMGGYGDDAILSSFGDAVISGGRGNDTIVASGGSNTYYYARGDGTDHIADTGAKWDAAGNPTPNRLRFAAGITPESLQLSVGSTGSLAIRVGADSNDVVHLDGFNRYSPLASQPIDFFEFDDGSVVSYAQLLSSGFDIEGTAGADTLNGTAMADRMFGGDGADTIDAADGADWIVGGRGNDALYGGGGDDTYYFERGDGEDRIGDWVGAPGNINRIQFGPDVAQADLVFSRRANGDLNIAIAGTTDSITIGNWYLGDGSVSRGIQQLGFADGSQFDTSAVDSLEVAPITGGAGDDVLTGTGFADTIEGGAGNDTLDGGAGNDALNGGIGSDVYVFGRGYGEDGISDGAGDGDVIRFDAGISPGDVLLFRDTASLYLRIDGTSDTLTVTDWFSDPANRVEKVEFADGSVWDSAVLAAAVMGTLGGTGDDTLVGKAGDDALLGGGGNDKLYGVDGADLLDGGVGHDTLDGGTGNDMLFGQADNDRLFGDRDIDILYGGDGADYLDGGAGSDTLYGEAGNDSLDGGDGADLLVGGAGDDGYWLADLDDLIIEDVGAGTDWVLSNIDYSLGDNVERLGLFGTATHGSGNALDNYIAGNRDLGGVLSGGAGNDSLSGGAYGDNFLYGGTGNDNLFGGNGSDVLDGGTGSDFMIGWDGDDLYLVDSEGDQVLEMFSPPPGMIPPRWLPPPVGWLGIDTVESSIDYELGAYIENLRLVGNAIHGYGNELDNVLTGNALDNILSGGAGDDTLDGGAGSDYLDGKGGNDVYLFGRGYGEDLVREGAGDADVVRFAADILPSDVLLFRDAANLYLQIGGTSDTLTVTGWFGDPDSRVEKFEFADGTVWDSAVLAAAPMGNGATEGPDYLPGTAGNDSLIGGGGDDTLKGGAGVDQLYGGDDRDTYLFSRGDGQDTIFETADSTSAIDTIRFATLPDDLKLTVDGGDLLVSIKDSTDAIRIHGQVWGGDDWPNLGLSGWGIERFSFANGVTWDAQEIAQHVEPSNEGPIHTSTPADDLLYGGAGDDVYIYGPGGGVDRIFDSGGNDILSFEAGIDPANVTLGLGSLFIRTGAGEDAIHIEGFNPDDALSNPVIDQFQFADGTSLSYVELLARGFDISGAGALRGTNLDDRVTGSDGDDTLYGGDGADTLDGGAGNDVLTGGKGDDVLMGGAGNDRYVIGLGDGVDRVIASEGSDTLAIGSALDEASLSLDRAGDDLSIHVTGTEDVITLDNWFVQPHGVDRVEFSDGSFLDRAGIESMFNAPPVANADQLTVLEGDHLVTIAAASLLANDTDPNPGDVLSVASVGPSQLGAAVSLADGVVTYEIGDAFEALAEGEIVSDTFGYSIADGQGAEASAVVAVEIMGTNDIPVVAGDFASTVEDASLPVGGNVLANDRDIDRGTVLSVVAPGELEGNYGRLTVAGDGSYSYSLNNGSWSVESLGRNVQVVDGFDYTVTDGLVDASSTLDIVVSGSNDAPIVVAPLGDQQVNFNKPFFWQVPRDGFADVDVGDELAFSASSADGSPLPEWLQFDAQSLSFWGVAPRAELSVDIRLIATDQVAASGSTEGNLSVSDVFRLEVQHGNEGLGNGFDAPPPGHDTNYNDSPERLREMAAPSPSPVNSGDAAEHEAAPSEPDFLANWGSASGIPSYLNAGVWDETEPFQSGGSANNSSAVFARWLAMDQALSESLRGRRAVSWLDERLGSDPSISGKSAAGYLGTSMLSRKDPLSLPATSGYDLKTFRGLSEGLQNIA